MSSLGQAVAEYLSHHSGVLTAMGTGGATRITRSSRVAGDALPAIVIEIISENGDAHQTGQDETVQARVRLRHWAVSESAAEALDEATYAALGGKPAGSLGNGTSTIVVKRVEWITAGRDYLESQNGRNIGDFCKWADYYIWHVRQVPVFP